MSRGQLRIRIEQLAQKIQSFVRIVATSAGPTAVEPVVVTRREYKRELESLIEIVSSAQHGIVAGLPSPFEISHVNYPLKLLPCIDHLNHAVVLGFVVIDAGTVTHDCKLERKGIVLSRNRLASSHE